MVLETPLRSRHEALGARMVPFGGWNMPVQYAPILDEARLVRSKVGLFDLCHMGRFTFEGPDAETLLQKVLTNDLSKIKPGVIRYALICKEDGTVIDDVLVYRDPDTHGDFFLVVNASNIDKDMAWIVSHAGDLDCKITDRSQELAMLALQGPRSVDTLQKVCDVDLSSLGYYKWTYGKVLGIDCSISRTGYTGEDGFEVYFPQARVEEFWDELLEAGTEFGIAPIGLGARDALRLEAGMSLYGHEIDESIHPLEAGLSWAVRLGKDFIGRDALARIKEEGLSRKLVGFLCEGKRVPRQGYDIASKSDKVGFVCSGTWSTVKDAPIATGYLPLRLAEAGTRVDIMVKDKIIPAEVVPLPFYKRESLPSRGLALSIPEFNSKQGRSMAPSDRKYQKSHEWALPQGDLIAVGISDVAVEQLSDLVYIELPAVGTSLTQGEAFGEIESVKAVSDLLSPVTGEVIEVNEDLADELDKLSSSPYEAGWMLKVRPEGTGGMENLLDAEAYAKHAAEDAH